MGHPSDHARIGFLLAAIGLALPAAAQSDPLAEPFDQTFDWRELLPSQGGDGSLGYVLRNCETEWILSRFRPPRGAGDVNGDGIDDLLHPVVQRSPSLFGFGVLMSDRTTPAVLDVSDPLSNHGFQLRLSPIHGGATASVGDITGDGLDDVAGWRRGVTCSRGCYYYDRSTIVFGRDEATAGPFDPINPETPMLDIGGSIFDLSGVGGRIGDVNGDGIDDLMATQSGVDGFGSIVVFGRQGIDQFPRSESPRRLAASGGGVDIGSLHPDFQHLSVSRAAGDVNRDGIADLIQCTSQRTERQGAFVVFGRSSSDPFPDRLDVATADASEAAFFEIEPSQSHVLSAGSVGDVSGDGIDDFAILSVSEIPSYRLYVIFGRQDSHRDPFPPVTNLAGLDGSNGFRLDAGSESVQDLDIQPLGDINGDQVGDLLLKDRIILGRRDLRYESHIQVSDLQPTEMVMFNGYLRVVGDVNDDGVPDLSLGNLNGADCEVAAIIYGRRPPPPCPADMDRDGTLTIYDWLTFTNAWEAQDPLADVDGDGAFSLLDFLVYQVWFAAGCP